MSKTFKAFLYHIWLLFQIPLAVIIVDWCIQYLGLSYPHYMVVVLSVPIIIGGIVSNILLYECVDGDS